MPVRESRESKVFSIRVIGGEMNQSFMVEKPYETRELGREGVGVSSFTVIQKLGG